jgi:hypothetical protein
VTADDLAKESGPVELGARLRFALSMVETGVELMRCNLQRAHPDAGADRIQELLNEWLLRRPIDEFGEDGRSSLRLRGPLP